METRPGSSDQQHPATSTEQRLMAVNMQALSASISSAVQLAVAEAMASRTQQGDTVLHGPVSGQYSERILGRDHPRYSITWRKRCHLS